MFRTLAIVLLSFIVACSSNVDDNAVIFNYKDFGPQVIANEVIGMEWWQWQPYGESRPTQYGIKVVVYRNEPLNRIEDIYPVIPEQKKDYRYLEYDAALVYLDEKISENIIEDVTVRLKKTREMIVTKLGDNN